MEDMTFEERIALGYQIEFTPIHDEDGNITTWTAAWVLPSEAEITETDPGESA